MEFERNWDQLPIAELQQLDAVCDHFEQALAADPATRVESFVGELTAPLQQLLLRELVQIEVEQRHASGDVPTPDDYARRFPHWAEELRPLIEQHLKNLDNERIAQDTAETVHKVSVSFSDTWTGKLRPPDDWAAEWRMSTSVRPLADLPADGVLGHYHLRSVIGRGGMGLVVRARDTRLGRDVALKILKTEFSHDASAHEHFLREAQAVAVIQHYNVVTIYDVEEILGIPFLAMELVEGTTLAAYLRENRRPSVGEVVSLSGQIAQGLAAAHKQGLVHRDIKPANILLEKIDQLDGGLKHLSCWHVKITDFGLARVAAGSQLSGSGMILGTPKYMSPEQASGEHIDFRSDLFSLGCVMYSMCAGQAAFSAESAVTILRQVVDVPARSLNEVNPETPGWLVAIVEKLMSKSPDNRFQSAAELVRLLAHHECDLLSRVTPSRVTAAPRDVPEHRRPRRLMLITLAIFGVAAAGLGILFRNSHRTGVADLNASAGETADGTVAEDIDQLGHGQTADVPPPAVAPFTAAEAVAHQKAWAMYLDIPVEYTNSMGMKFRLIPPGEFSMGTSEKEIAELLEEAKLRDLPPWYSAAVWTEGPQRRVTLTRPFAISIHEVTRGQFRQFVESTEYETDANKDSQGGFGWEDGTWTQSSAYHWNTQLGYEEEQTPEHPVVNISWNDATAFCHWMSEKEGILYRLPTEAEWEYACRAGTISRYTCSDDEGVLKGYSWNGFNGGIGTKRVGLKKANAFGLYDIHGSLREWCQDNFGSYRETDVVDPIGATDDSFRSLRGGSFDLHPAFDRSATRYAFEPTIRGNIGFRVTGEIK